MQGTGRSAAKDGPPCSRRSEPRCSSPEQDPRPAPRALSRSARTELADILAEGAVEAGFQPVVELATGRVIGWEALARGPRGSALESPTACSPPPAPPAGWRSSTGSASATRCAPRSPPACRRPCILFLNIEPDTSGFLPLELRDLYARASAQMTVCVEVTERALTTRPGALLGHIADMRAMGVAVALDDVGTDADTLAMMSLLAPEVIKLDLALVQNSPDADIAEVVHAVAAQAERSGATILVEGVETLDQARAGDALGASLAQGWLYGRREVEIELPDLPAIPIVLPGRHADPRDLAPFALVAEHRAPRITTPAAAARDDPAPRGPGARTSAARRCSSPRSTRTATSAREHATRYAQLGRDLAFCGVVGRGVSAASPRPASTAPRSSAAIPSATSGRSPSSARTSRPRSSRTSAAPRGTERRARSTTTC